jgi:hypothetical protein
LLLDPHHLRLLLQHHNCWLWLLQLLLLRHLERHGLPHHILLLLL